MEERLATDLGFARLDTERVARTGDPEVVYGAGKSPAPVSYTHLTLPTTPYV